MMGNQVLASWGWPGATDCDVDHTNSFFIEFLRAVALAFDLLALDGEDLRRKPFAERKAALRKILKRTRRGIQYVEHSEGNGSEMLKASSGLRASFQRN